MWFIFYAQEDTDFIGLVTGAVRMRKKRQTLSGRSRPKCLQSRMSLSVL